jgi:hypothetical protein
MSVNYSDLRKELERAMIESGGVAQPEPPAPAEDLNGPWGDRSPAPYRNDVDGRTRILPGRRVVEGAGEIASQPRVPKIKG